MRISKNEEQHHLQKSFSENTISFLPAKQKFCQVCHQLIKDVDLNFCKDCNLPLHYGCGHLLKDDEVNSFCSLCMRKRDRKIVSQDVFKRQKLQAEKMETFSEEAFPPLKIGDSVTVSVPTVDRGPLDFPNIHAVVLKIENGVFQVGTKNGTIKGWLPRTDLAKNKSNTILGMSDVMIEKTISLREALALQSMTGGQGYVKCSCKASINQCRTNRCKCFKFKVLCNSRCHSSATCGNK